MLEPEPVPCFDRVEAFQTFAHYLTENTHTAEVSTTSFTFVKEMRTKSV